MKKIFLIFFFICFIPNVSGIDNCKSETKESLWYKIEEESKYFKLNENEKTYPLLDKKSFYETDFTNWINVEPEKKEGRKVEERKIYTYKDAYPIHYLFIHNFSYEGNKLYIRELEIYDKEDMEVPYKITCTNCSKDFSETVNDGNVLTGEAYVNENSIIKIEFLNYEPTEKLRIYIYTNTEQEESPTLEINATEKDDIKDVFYHKDYKINILNLINQKRYYFNIPIRTLEKKNPRYKEEIRSEKKVEEKYNRYIKEEKEYRYKDTFYRYYNVKKIYNTVASKKGNSEYPYKEIGIETSQKHCLQNKIITLKNKIPKEGFSFQNFPKLLGKKNVTKEECICKKETKSNFFKYLSLVLILYIIVRKQIEKRKGKLVNPSNE